MKYRQRARSAACTTFRRQIANLRTGWHKARGAPPKSGLTVRAAAAAAACCALLLTACSVAPAWERLPATPLSMAVQPGKIGEECFGLAAGERIEYQFEASVSLDFNLHTHRGREVVMPVTIEQTRAQAGTFTSPQREDYCMMWTNRSAVPAHLKGEWRRLR